MYKPRHATSFSFFLPLPSSLSFCFPPFLSFIFPFFFSSLQGNLSISASFLASLVLRFFNPVSEPSKLHLVKSLSTCKESYQAGRVVSDRPCLEMCQITKKNFIPFMGKQIEFAIKLSHCDRFGIKDKCLDFFKW